MQSTAEQQNVMSIEQLNIKIRKSLKGHNAKVNISRIIRQKEGKETAITPFVDVREDLFIIPSFNAL